MRRTTLTGALCLLGVAGSSLGAGRNAPLAAVAAAAVGTVVFWLLGRTLRAQLAQVAAAIESLADGPIDLSRRLPRMLCDETQRIADAVCDHLESLHAETRIARELATRLADHAQELSLPSAAAAAAVLLQEQMRDMSAALDRLQTNFAAIAEHAFARQGAAAATEPAADEDQNQDAFANSVSIDALAIGHELDTLQGVPDDDVATVDLPPHPLSWMDAADATTRVHEGP